MDSLTGFSHSIKSLNAGSPENLLKLLGELKSLKRTIEDLNFYTEAKDRVEAFKKAVSDGIDKDEAGIFADLLKFKLNH